MSVLAICAGVVVGVDADAGAGADAGAVVPGAGRIIPRASGVVRTGDAIVLVRVPGADADENLRLWWRVRGLPKHEILVESCHDMRAWGLPHRELAEKEHVA